MSGDPIAEAIVRDCERLILDSAAHNDERDWAALAALYADDARLTRPSGQTVDGRAAIEASYRSGPAERRTRHLCTNIRVLVTDRDRAHATTAVLLVSWMSSDGTAGLPNATDVMIGAFDDSFVRVARGWRIATRVARLDVRLA